MPIRSILSALLLILCLSAPALAEDSSGGQEITGPVINEDFCPG